MLSVVERVIEPDVFLIEDRVSAELGVGYVGVSFPFDTVGDIPVISVTIPGSFFPVSI